jgi:hypothetical protein
MFETEEVFLLNSGDWLVALKYVMLNLPCLASLSTTYHKKKGPGRHPLGEA